MVYIQDMQYIVMIYVGVVGRWYCVVVHRQRSSILSLDIGLIFVLFSILSAHLLAQKQVCMFYFFTLLAYVGANMSEL